MARRYDIEYQFVALSIRRIKGKETHHFDLDGTIGLAGFGEHVAWPLAEIAQLDCS